MWVVMRMHKWSAFNAQLGSVEVPVSIGGDMPDGFLPVFDSFDDAMEWDHGQGSQILEVGKVPELTTEEPRDGNTRLS